jgi:hypothetical protein
MRHRLAADRLGAARASVPAPAAGMPQRAREAETRAAAVEQAKCHDGSGPKLRYFSALRRGRRSATRRYARLPRAVARHFGRTRLFSRDVTAARALITPSA